MTTTVVARCWAVRTDRRHRADLILPELRRGVLRQGWGYFPEQDLRLIRARLIAGDDVGDDEYDAWSRNRRLLPDEPDGISVGDWLLLPNLPADGRWTLARAGDTYDFEIACTGDHGHARAVTVVREDIDPRVIDVPAGLRRTTRCQRALWNLDGFLPDVARLGGALSERPPIDRAIADVVAAAQAAAWVRLRHHFGGAELEGPIAMLLRELYNDVEQRGGPCERGADLICHSTDPLGLPTTVAVQVKMWDGAADDPEPFTQLAEAARNYPGLTGVVVMTTAERTTTSFEAAATSLEAQIGIPVRVLDRSALIRLFLAHAAAGTTDENAVQ